MGFLRCQRLTLLGVVLAWAAGGIASAQATREYDLKAAFLYNFAAFVDWPPHAFPGENAPFVIGVLGTDPFGVVLDEMVRGELAKDRPLVVRRLTRVSDAPDCHILFISRSEAARLPEILRYCQERAVLTVSDLPGFVYSGGMIGFTTEGKRVLLHVNPHAAASAKLVISSKLLRVAYNVTGGVQ
jgi:hypothetical protein